MKPRLFRSINPFTTASGPWGRIKNISALPALLFCMLSTLTATAQNAAPSWLENSLYASGKINTVVVVVAVILIGIALWLFALDRKLRKLEEKINKPSI